jgi:hypothetical protein
VVHAHHGAWLEACRGVAGLEDRVALLRNYVNGLSALVAALRGMKPLGKEVGGGGGGGVGGARRWGEGGRGGGARRG